MARKQRKKEEWENNMVETKTIADRIVDVIVYLCVALVALCSVRPMWHVLMSSFSDGKSLLAHVGLVLWPVGGFTLDGENYHDRDTDWEAIWGFGGLYSYDITDWLTASAEYDILAMRSYIDHMVLLYLLSHF